jgi:hypothetical protein
MLFLRLQCIANSKKPTSPSIFCNDTFVGAALAAMSVYIAAKAAPTKAKI